MKFSGPNDAAFPRSAGATGNGEANLEQDGMTIREWYAGLAMQSLAPTAQIANDEIFDRLAKRCFDIADAMLRYTAAERKAAMSKFKGGDDDF